MTKKRGLRALLILSIAAAASTVGQTASAAPMSASSFVGWVCGDAGLSASHRTATVQCDRQGNPSTTQFRTVVYCTRGNPGIGPWRGDNQLSSATCPSSGADVTEVYHQFR